MQDGNRRDPSSQNAQLREHLLELQSRMQEGDAKMPDNLLPLALRLAGNTIELNDLLRKELDALRGRVDGEDRPT